MLIRTLFCVEDGDTKTRLRRILRAQTDTFVETARSAAVAIVVSSTDGNVRVFHLGVIVLQLDPGLSSTATRRRGEAP